MLIFKLPKRIPPVPVLLDDLALSLGEVARLTGIPQSTIYRWRQDGHAPRTAQLALFWLTRWGWSQLDCQLFDRFKDLQLLVDAQRRVIDELRSQLGQVAAIGDFGSGNSPLIGVSAPSAPLPSRPVLAADSVSGLQSSPSHIRRSA